MRPTVDRPASVPAEAAVVTPLRTGRHRPMGIRRLLLDNVPPSTGTPCTVPVRSSGTYVGDAADTYGRYGFFVYGADGFVRRFSGTIVHRARTTWRCIRSAWQAGVAALRVRRDASQPSDAQHAGQHREGELAVGGLRPAREEGADPAQCGLLFLF